MLWMKGFLDHLVPSACLLIICSELINQTKARSVQAAAFVLRLEVTCWPDCSWQRSQLLKANIYLNGFVTGRTFAKVLSFFVICHYFTFLEKPFLVVMGSKLLVTAYVFGAIFAVVGILGAAFGNDLIHYFVTSVRHVGAVSKRGALFS